MKWKTTMDETKDEMLTRALTMLARSYFQKQKFKPDGIKYVSHTSDGHHSQLFDCEAALWMMIRSFLWCTLEQKTTIGRPPFPNCLLIQLHQALKLIRLPPFGYKR